MAEKCTAFCGVSSMYTKACTALCDHRNLHLAKMYNILQCIIDVHIRVYTFFHHRNVHNRTLNLVLLMYTKVRNGLFDRNGHCCTCTAPFDRWNVHTCIVYSALEMYIAKQCTAFCDGIKTQWIS